MFGNKEKMYARICGSLEMFQKYLTHALNYNTVSVRLQNKKTTNPRARLCIDVHKLCPMGIDWRRILRRLWKTLDLLALAVDEASSESSSSFKEMSCVLHSGHIFLYLEFFKRHDVWKTWLHDVRHISRFSIGKRQIEHACIILLILKKIKIVF